jgi:hypothetical protein
VEQEDARLYQVVFNTERLSVDACVNAVCKLAAAAALVALALCNKAAAESAEIRVFSSAAPRGVFGDLVPDFERTTGHRLLINYEFAADLKRRIEAGHPFDVAILPPDLADDLVQRGKVAAGLRVDLGRTGMGVARSMSCGGLSWKRRRSRMPTAERPAHRSVTSWRGWHGLELPRP